MQLVIQLKIAGGDNTASVAPSATQTAVTRTTIHATVTRRPVAHSDAQAKFKPPAEDVAYIDARGLASGFAADDEVRFGARSTCHRNSMMPSLSACALLQGKHGW